MLQILRCVTGKYASKVKIRQQRGSKCEGVIVVAAAVTSGAEVLPVNIF